MWFVCRPSQFWWPDLNANSSLMLPDISDPSSEPAEQTAELDDWCLCGSQRLQRKCQCSLNYAWSDKWSCFIDISSSYIDGGFFLSPTKMPSRFWGLNLAQQRWSLKVLFVFPFICLFICLFICTPIYKTNISHVCWQPVEMCHWLNVSLSK